jgi:hypothetical protein
MIDAESCRQYAADCVRQAEVQEAAEDKNILLNVALAWVRLAHQTQAFRGEDVATETPVLELEVMAEAEPEAEPARKLETTH